MGSKPWTSVIFENYGGDKQDRTADLLHAMQALSQLSYTPSPHNFYSEAVFVSKPQIIYTNLGRFQSFDNFFSIK